MDPFISVGRELQIYRVRGQSQVIDAQLILKNLFDIPTVHYRFVFEELC